MILSVEYQRGSEIEKIELKNVEFIERDERGTTFLDEKKSFIFHATNVISVLREEGHFNI